MGKLTLGGGLAIQLNLHDIVYARRGSHVERFQSPAPYKSHIGSVRHCFGLCVNSLDVVVLMVVVGHYIQPIQLMVHIALPILGLALALDSAIDSDLLSDAVSMLSRKYVELTMGDEMFVEVMVLTPVQYNRFQ